MISCVLVHVHLQYKEITLISTHFKYMCLTCPNSLHIYKNKFDVEKVLTTYGTFGIITRSEGEIVSHTQSHTFFNHRNTHTINHDNEIYNHLCTNITINIFQQSLFLKCTFLSL